MSADNWAVCPGCHRPESLREDYEIGIVNGKFEVHYSSKCYYFGPGIKPGCGFEYQFTIEKPIT